MEIAERVSKDRGSRCDMCGVEAVCQVFVLPVKDGPFADGGSFHWRPFFQCRSCGYTVAGSYEPQHYKQYYRSLSASYYDEHDHDRHRYDVIHQSLPRLDFERALDWGCGAGGFLTTLPATVQKFGVELSAVGAERAAQNGVQILTQDELASQRFRSSFDLITAIDVIEHVSEPRALFHRWAMLLSPNGLLVLLTGDLHSRPARLLGRYWYYLHYGEHISFHTKSSLTKVLKTYFQNVKISTTTHHPVPPLAWVRSGISFCMKWTAEKAGFSERFLWFPSLPATSDHLLVIAGRKNR